MSRKLSDAILRLIRAESYRKHASSVATTQRELRKAADDLDQLFAAAPLTRASVVGDVHCDLCGETFRSGDQVFCRQDTDGSIIWYCDVHVPNPIQPASVKPVVAKVKVETELREGADITVEDAQNEDSGFLDIHLIKGPRGISVHFPNFGDKCSDYFHGVPLVIEYRHGIPYVIIWGDINQEEPTHTISLEGAAVNKRKR